MFSKIVHLFFKMTMPPVNGLDKQIHGNRKTEFKNLTGLHNPQTLISYKLSGVVSKLNCFVRFMALKNVMT